MKPRALSSLPAVVLFAALRAAAARVESVPQLTAVPAVPSAPVPVLSPTLGASPLPLTAAAALSAAPLAAPVAAPAAFAVTPAPAVAPAPSAAAALPAAARDGSHPTLAQTLALPQPEYSKLGGAESSAAAGKDFEARAQLGGPSEGSAPVVAVPAASDGPRLRLAKPAGSARAAASPVETPSVSGVDRDGRLLRAALARLAAAPQGAALALDFTPTAASARALGEEGGALLLRGRVDGKWRLTRAGAGFAAADDDFDAAVLGRADGGWPTAADLRESEGRAARFLIASPGRLVEWNSDLDPRAADALDGSAWRRAAARAASALGLSGRALRLAGAAVEARSWDKTSEDVLEAGRAPVAERQMAGTLIPSWMREELPVTAARLGRPLTPEYSADVLARSKVWVYTWHSRWTYEVSGGLPDGHYDPRFGIRVMLKTDWRKLKDPKTHFRVLWAHEYTHWLQNEGLVTNRYGIEIPPVAVEQLRAVELVGIEGMEGGRIGWMGKGSLDAFQDGRKWAHGEMREASAPYWRGFLGGVAYEVGRIAGRPEAAWEFLNLVIAEKGGLTPRQAFERVTGRKK